MVSKQMKRGLLGAALALSGAVTAQAAVVTIDFEGASFVEFTSAGSAVSGVTFANDWVLKSGSTLNEVDYPPRSGSQVVSDNTGPIEVSFASGMVSVGAYLTYTERVVLEAFDGAGVSLGQIDSLYSENFGSATGPGVGTPNEFVSFSDAAGRIRSVRFSGNALGGSFTLDDLTFDDGRTGQVPAPPTLLLAGLCLALVASTRRRSSSQQPLSRARSAAV